MTSTTAAGSALAVCASSPATEDVPGYSALTFVEAGNIEKIGTLGSTFAKVDFQPLKGPKQKYKGSVDYGALTPTMAIDASDAGQTLLRTAADDTTSKLYSFKVTYQDGSLRFFQGRVFGNPETTDGADTMLMAAPTLEISTKIIRG